MLSLERMSLELLSPDERSVFKCDLKPFHVLPLTRSCRSFGSRHQKMHKRRATTKLHTAGGRDVASQKKFMHVKQITVREFSDPNLNLERSFSLFNRSSLV